MIDHLQPEAVHPTVLAERMREDAIPTASIARILGLAVTVVQRWFDLIDELAAETDGQPGGAKAGSLSTAGESRGRSTSDSYENVRS